ncbi:WXG100 family type VII secretion target [Nocardia panacis]|nr:WXG100 family type VII secretion target [Nocardia panacis]
MVASSTEFAMVPESVRGAGEFIVATAQALMEGFRAADAEVRGLRASWRGTAADAYGAGWEQVHRGALAAFDALKELATALGACAEAVAAVDARRAEVQRNYMSSLVLP